VASVYCDWASTNTNDKPAKPEFLSARSETARSTDTTPKRSGFGIVPARIEELRPDARIPTGSLSSSTALNWRIATRLFPPVQVPKAMEKLYRAPLTRTVRHLRRVPEAGGYYCHTMREGTRSAP